MLASVLLTAGLLVGAVPGPVSQAAWADGGPAVQDPEPGDSWSFATYNMQGSLSGRRWTEEVGPLTMRHEIVVLQEVGSGPPDAPLQYHGTGESIPIPNSSPPNLPNSVRLTRWEYEGQHRYVYFLQTDPQRSSTTGQDRWRGGRVNLAMVTHARADEVRVIRNPLYQVNGPNNAYRYRRVLGLRFGHTVYYNIHARPGGRDVPFLLNQIRDATRPGENWVVTGDFNTDIVGRNQQTARQMLGVRASEELDRPDRPTHQSGGELDYAITRGVHRFNADIPEGRGPDHYAVHFEPVPTPVPAPPDGPAPDYSSAFVNAETGNVLSVTNSTVITAPDHYGDGQRFDMSTVQGHWYRFSQGNSPTRVAGGAATGRAAATQRCPGLNPVAPLMVMPRPCDAADAQWRPDEVPGSDGPLRWHNSALPNLCLTATNRSDALVMALPCTDSRSQQWWDEARHVTSWHDGDDQVRLRASNGLYLATLNGWGLDGTPLTGYGQSLGGRWDIQYASPDSNVVRLKSRTADKCANVPNTGSGAGVRVVLHGCMWADSKDDGSGERWVAEVYADGTVRLRNEATHRCLLPTPWAGIPLSVGVCNDEAYQRWTIER
ncbi:hypothetical protein AVL59_24830 [Streptomyces griseochromogenes]|uniref:Endonuclease/exonuclease/phosphatase domain-containing protein n=1 Tax=Streptomyces griseochromogenes TaxID=68214 RepID=A0A1B1B0J7_9ACTN|nr:hypothetical protein AVL59_24830 [Streptomyces griseochromogenes]